MLAKVDTKFYTSLIYAIILLAFGLRIWGLDSQSLRGDEAASVTYASLPAPKILEITRFADPHPPLFYLVLHGWEKLVGPTEFAVRFWVLLPGVLAVASIYGFTQQLVNRQVALMAALLLAINSFHVWHSQDVRSYTWLMVLGIWSVWILWRAIKTHHWINWAWYAVIIAVLLYTHYYAIFLVVGQGIYILQVSRSQGTRHTAKKDLAGLPIWTGRRILISWVISLVAVGLAFLPWISLSWRFISGFTGDFDPALPHIVLWRGLNAFNGGLIDKLAPVSLWSTCLMLFACLGLWQFWRNNRSASIYLWLYLGLPILGVIALTLRGQAFTERYLMAALPPYLILLGIAFISLISGKSAIGRSMAVCGLIVVFGLNGQVLWRNQNDPDLAKSPEWRQLFAFVQQHQNPETDLLIYDFPEASITYYLDTIQTNHNEDSRIDARLVPSDPNLTDTDVERQLLDLCAVYERVWYVPVNSRGWDDEKRVQGWLSQYTDRHASGNFHWANVNLFLTPHGILKHMEPQVVTFANGITLHGFRIFNTITPDQAANTFNKNSFDLSLYWTKSEPIEASLTVFTQLIDTSGVYRGGHDRKPDWGIYPIQKVNSADQATEFIIDNHHLTLYADAPQGIYQIWVGLYDPYTGARIPIVDAHGMPLADHVVLDFKFESEH